MPYQEKPTTRQLLSRASYYVWGLAIGCVLLGVFQIGKRAQAQRMARQEAQLQADIRAQQAADSAAREANQPASTIEQPAPSK